MSANLFELLYRIAVRALWLRHYSPFAFLTLLLALIISALPFFITTDSHTTVMRGLVVPLLERINRETTTVVSGAECVTILEHSFPRLPPLSIDGGGRPYSDLLPSHFATPLPSPIIRTHLERSNFFRLLHVFDLVEQFEELVRRRTPHR